MIEGYDNDDIYMMVEDEFLTTAHTFTMHLHQEEYERRKKQAKTRNAHALGGPARPVDPKARMIAETKMNIEAQNAAKRHKAALDGMTDGVQRPRVDSEEDEDIGEGTDDDRDDDPWVGTQLHTLMTSPRVSRSLIGLQGVKSNTRAALGYGNPSAKRKTSPTPAPKFSVGARQPFQQPIDVEDTTSGDDDDDLGAPSRKSVSRASAKAPRSSGIAALELSRVQRTEPVAKPPTVTTPAQSLKSHKLTTTSVKFREPTRRPCTVESASISRSNSANASAGPTSSNSSFKSTSRSRMSKLLDDFDEEFEYSIKTEPISPKHTYMRGQSMISSNGQREHERKHEREIKSRKDRLSEVPTFL